MKLSELYSEYFANWVSGGSMVNRDRISLLGIKPLFDRFVTHRYITKVWMVRCMPVCFEYNLTDLVRGEMFKSHPSVKTTIHFVGKPVSVSVRNNIFMRQFEAVSEKYHKMDDFFNSLTEDQRLAGVYDINPQTGRKVSITQKDLRRIQEEYDSYMYIYGQATANHAFYNTFYFIQASCTDRKELRGYTKSLEGLLGRQQVVYSELHGNIDAYLNNFCPASYVHRGIGKFTHMLMTGENMVGMMPYKTRGLVGGKGVLLGLDVMSGLPFWLDFFNSGSAQICMLIGKTGCGKTYFAFAVALGLVAMGVHFSAIDIKGGEWTKVSRYVEGMLEIDMGGANSCFVNTMRLDDMHCDSPEEAMEAFDTAVRGTVGTFEVITALSAGEGNPADLHSILNKAVMKVMNSHGVISDNPSTFDRTKGLGYADVLSVVQDLMTSAAYTEDQRRMCQLVIIRSSDYFLAEGRYAVAMIRELTLEDVYASPAVIYNFNKNKNVMLDTLDSLRVYWVQFLDGKKQSERKRRKLHTAAFYEELQRCGQFGLLVDEINHKVTGSRSNNVIIFLLLNSVSTFNSDAFLPTKSNITTKIVGKLPHDDVAVMTEKFDCAPIRDYMYRISDDGGGQFSNCFAIQYDTGVDTDVVVCRTVMPPEMSENFNTRDRMG